MYEIFLFSVTLHVLMVMKSQVAASWVMSLHHYMVSLTQMSAT